jgi:hypothetical protein
MLQRRLSNQRFPSLIKPVFGDEICKGRELRTSKKRGRVTRRYRALFKLCRRAFLLRRLIYSNAHRPKPLALSFNPAAELSCVSTQFYRNRIPLLPLRPLPIAPQGFYALLRISEEGASAKAFCAFFGLPRKVFTLPVSIWRHNKFSLISSQCKSLRIPVQICEWL